MAFFFMMLSMHSIIQHAYATSVVIVADYEGDDGTMRYGLPVCSGFVVSSDKATELIATARHCTNEVDDRAVQFFDGDIGRVEGVLASQDADVAVLVVQSRRSHPIVQFSGTLDPGDRCFMVGMPSGDMWSYSTLYSRNGSQVFETQDDGPALTFEAPAVYEGDSGGAIYNPLGQVVAVLDGGDDPERPNVVFASPASYVQAMIK